MFRATITGVLSRRRRLFLCGTAIVLAVLFITGALVFTETVRASQAATYARMYRDVDVVIEARAVPPGPDEAEPVTTVPSAVLEQVRRQPGVRAVTGVVNAPGVRILGANGKILDTTSSAVLGANWRAGDSYVRLRSGRGPAGDGEVAVNAALADAADLAPGRTVTLLTDDLARRSFAVVGVYGYAEGRDSARGACELAFQTPVVARLLLGDADRYTELHVTAGPQEPAGRLRERLAGAVGPGYQVSTGREHVAALVRRDDARGRDVFRRILLGFTAVAVLVGTLLITNTFLILVAQRTRELALLRALGASRPQLVGSVLAEAALVGVAGTLLGVAAGIGLGSLLVLGADAVAGLDLGAPRVPAIALITAVVVGVPVTLLASLPPAVRAARIPPVAAMREEPATTRTRRLRTRRLRTSRLGTSRLRTSRLRIARLWIPRLRFPRPHWTERLRRTSRPRSAARGGGWSVPARLGWRNALRNRRRTALTASALMIGVTVAAGAGVVVASANASLRQQATRELDLTFMVQSTGDGGGIAPAVVDRVAALDGVSAVSGTRLETARISVPGRAAAVEEEVASVTDLAAAGRMFSLTVRSGRLAAATGDTLLVDAATARRYHLAVGRTVTMAFSGDRSKVCTVTGVFADSNFLPSWVAGPELAAYLTGQAVAEVAVTVGSDSQAPRVRHEIDQLVASDPTVTVSSLPELVAAAGAKFNQVLLAVMGLLALSIVIAVLGLVNTLRLSILERTRELGTLRAVGLSRRQTMRMIAVEAVVMAAIGGTGGGVLGIALGVVGVYALHGQGITRTTVPWFELACYLGLSAVIGVLASVAPARRAARGDVLAAIATTG